MAVTHGSTLAIDDPKYPGLTRYFVKIADASTKTSLLAALGANIKGRVISGRLEQSVAGAIYIYQGSESQPQTYDNPAGATVWNITWEEDRIQSNDNELLNIESSVAMTIDGFLDVFPMGTGALSS